MQKLAVIAKVAKLPGTTSLNKGVGKLQVSLPEYTEMEAQTISVV